MQSEDITTNVKSSCYCATYALLIALPSEIKLAISKSGEDSTTPSTLSHVKESSDIGDWGTCSFDETERYAHELLGDWGELSITKELWKRKEVSSKGKNITFF